jgi:hypothetical protein
LEADIELMPADGKVGIGDPMPSETDANLTISDQMRIGTQSQSSN